MGAMRNLSQATYDRIKEHCSVHDVSDKWSARGFRAVDVRDLLEAYEAAVTLLDQLRGIHRPAHLQDAVDDFLYMPGHTEPFVHRVVLDDGEDLSYSAPGMLRPAEVDSEDY